MPPLPTDSVAPQHVVVIGAASGIGRWLFDHVFHIERTVPSTLLDTSESIFSFSVTGTEAAPITLGRIVGSRPHAQLVDRDGQPLNLPTDNVLFVVAVPLDNTSEVADWLSPMVGDHSTVVVVSHDLQQTIREFTSQLGSTPVVGLHALFGTLVDRADGQTFVLCPSTASPTAHEWLSSCIDRVGGSTNVADPQRHDEIMTFVQTAAHHSLLTFADVIGRSGLHLEKDLWAYRTPVFELLLSLAGRVLTPGQELSTASIQRADDNKSIIRAFAEAEKRLENVLSTDASTDTSRGVSHADTDPLTQHLHSLRAPFTGGLFTKIQQAGAVATNGIQSARARIAEMKRSGRIVGVRSLVNNERLHVGTIEQVTATSFVLRDLLVGSTGNAALLIDEAAAANARRLGIAGKSKKVEFSLGRATVLSDAELETELDTWLARITRGTKFFVPESISGRSAGRVVASVQHVEHTELVSEEVRLGQRECVVRFHVRVDRRVADIERDIQRQIDEVYVWPDGVVLPLRLVGTSESDPVGIGFLGPAGTFSDLAARQLERLLARPTTIVEFPTFPDIVAAVESGLVKVAVVPISNSSSGLVDLAAATLASSSSAVRAGGVVDVPVRFDAFVYPGTDIVQGGNVLSHPQGFRQCSNFITASQMQEVTCTSTAEACRRVAEMKSGVALAAPGVGADFGLEVARASVGNLSGAVTRFLVIGLDGIFDAPPHTDALLRSVWIAEPGALDEPHDVGQRFDEVLQGPTGRALIVSSRPDRLPPRADLRFMGTMPWSPRTPIVTP